MFDDVYNGRRVLVTGHTGFKGSWLCAWLNRLGADVCGVALPMETMPNHYDLLHLGMRSDICDIREREKIMGIFSDFCPEVVFHLAAQPIVRHSYKEPAETFETNVMGTVNVLEAVRLTPSVRAVVVVSSDKCYENREQLRGYIETDAMGGYDPYSASKGCTELVVSSYRRSFFNVDDFGKRHHVLLASARAGNVVGGGDWAVDRLVPDLARNAAAGKTTDIRSPKSVRPWQHVLEPLSGYLTLAAKLLKGNMTFADAWNFGPDVDEIVSVEEAAGMLASNWNRIEYVLNPPFEQPHEAKLLSLNCSKAHDILKWFPVLKTSEAIAWTAEWYRSFYENERILTFSQLTDYVGIAKERGLEWTN